MSMKTIKIVRMLMWTLIIGMGIIAVCISDNAPNIRPILMFAGMALTVFGSVMMTQE